MLDPKIFDAHTNQFRDGECLHVVRRLQNRDELLSPVSRKMICRSLQNIARGHGRFFQNIVACLMPIGVVVCLELVKIEEQQGHRRIGTR